MAVTNEILRVVDFWENNGDEKSDTQLFWLQLLRYVLGIERPEELIKFEKRVSLEHMSFIDAYVGASNVFPYYSEHHHYHSAYNQHYCHY